VKAIAALVILAFSAGVWAESLERPPVGAGDSWVYRMTTERGQGWNQTTDEFTVVRVTPTTIFLSVQTSGSTQPAREIFQGNDWSRARDVNGKETVVNRPFAFPLSDGKTWDIAYTEDGPSKQLKTRTFETHYRVVGYEAVEVPAGKFRALKIEAEGDWKAQLAPSQSVVQGANVSPGDTAMVTHAQTTLERDITGKTYKAFWYAPEVKRWVKSVEEYYSTAGVRTERYTQELVSFKAAGSANSSSSP